MLVRYLTKGKLTFKVTLSPYSADATDDRGRQVEAGARSKREFDRLVKEKLNEGYAETEQSLSRRAFYHGKPDEGKFWIIELVDEAVHLQYGKIPSRGYSDRTGQKRVKDYDTTEQARKEYFKQVAKKLKEGYEEFHPRKTEYSEPPEGLLAKPAEAAKAEPQEAPAAEPPAREAAAAPIASSAETAVVREIRLDPEDWLWATWRPRAPKPRPEPAPFDLDACLALVLGFRRYVLPYLSESEVEGLRDQLRPRIDPSAHPANFYDPYPTEVYLAAVLGMGERLQPIVSSWTPDRFSGGGYPPRDYRHRPHLAGRAVRDAPGPAPTDDELRPPARMGRKRSQSLPHGRVADGYIH